MHDRALVLVADDDPQLLKVISRDLRDAGYMCVVVPDGEAAVAALRAKDFTVALIDLEMPKLDGFEVLAVLQREKLGVVPVVVTGTGDTRKAVRAMKLGAYDVVEKPANPAILNATVDRAATHRRLRDSARDLAMESKKHEAKLAVANAELRLEKARLETLWQLSRMSERSLQEVTHFAMEEGVRLTSSSIGYLAFMNEDETVLTMHAWSKTAMEQCAIMDKPIEYPVEKTGLWGEAVRQRKPVITNDYLAPNPLKKGTPEGHVRVTRHMNVPVFDEGHIVLVAGVGNKEGPYDSTDAHQLELLMAGMWRIVRQRRAEEQYRSAQEQLARLSSLKERLLSPLGLQEKLTIITEAVVSVFGADFARIWTLGEGDLCNHGCAHAAATEGPYVCHDRSHCFHLVASSGRYTHVNGVHQRVPRACHRVGLFASGEEASFVTNDAPHDPGVHNHEWAVALGLVSFAGWRLLSPDGNTVGVLAFFSKQPITTGQKHLLEDLSNTTSHVILTGLTAEALRESERKSQAILQGCPIPQFVIDRHHKVISWNKPMEKCTRLSQEQVLGTSEHWRAFYPKPRLCLADLLVDGATHLLPKYYGDKCSPAPLLEDAYQGTDYFPILGEGGTWLHFTAAPIRDAHGAIIGAMETFEDITERKRIEQALELRMLALTRPLGDTASELLFEDLFNLEEVQRIQDAFSAATGVGSIITRTDGTPITRPSNFCHLCEHIIRKTEKGLSNCYRSDAVLGAKAPGGPVLQPCLSGGLWDGGTSICVGDRHIANWLIGQVLEEPVDNECMLRYARDIGANEQEFADALAHVTRMPKKQFEKICEALYLIAKQLSNLAFQNVQQAQHITERKRAEEELQQARDALEKRVAERTIELTQANASLMNEIERRKLTEEELRKAHSEVERLLASMPSFLIGLGPDLRISRWNAAAETTFGIPWEDALGKQIDECNIGWDWSAIVAQIPNWPTLSETARLPDIRCTRTDGEDRFLGVTVNPVKNGSGVYEGCLLLGIDTTERRTLEGQLLQAQKLESVGRLAAGIAHEINTPTQYVGDNIEFLQIAYDNLLGLIEALLGIVQATQEDPVLPKRLSDARCLVDGVNVSYLTEQVPRAIDQALEGIGRITSIVQAMKEFSHPGIAEKTFADLNQCIRSTVTVSRNEWKYVADLELDLDDGLPLVPCLPGDFNQTILNLIVNAAHAIEDTIAGDVERKGHITISTRQETGCVVIRVADTGSGIAEGIRKRIFDPFFTTKEVGRGTGQGLAIARNVIVNKHGGTISVESKVGQGTTFIIRLPVEDRDAAVAPLPHTSQAE